MRGQQRMHGTAPQSVGTCPLGMKGGLKWFARPVTPSHIPHIFGPWLGLGSPCLFALQLGWGWGILESLGSEG